MKRHDLIRRLVAATLPAPGMANRKDSIDRIFRLVHVHYALHRRRHGVGVAVKNRLPNRRGEHRQN
jgi:hypothetical protein